MNSDDYLARAILIDFGSYSRLSRAENFEIWGIYIRITFYPAQIACAFYPAQIACAFIPPDINLNSFLLFEIEQDLSC